MTKKSNYSQLAGEIGEGEFQRWAAHMGWHPSKFNIDYGIDFICQLPQEDIGKKTVGMPGALLSVSVRSTTMDNASVRINKSDARLMLTTNTPMVLAIVLRGEDDAPGQVAIKFPDERFIRELDEFLRSDKKSLTLRFDEAITDKSKIEYNTKRLFRSSYAERLTQLRSELRVSQIVPKSRVEITNTDGIKYAVIRSSEFKTTLDPSIHYKIESELKDLGIYSFECLPTEHISTSTTIDCECFGVSDEVDSSLIKIHRLLNERNSETAVVLADKIVSQLDQINVMPTAATILLARTYVSYCENQAADADKVQIAFDILNRAKDISADENEINEIRSLSATLLSLTKKYGEAIKMLQDYNDPYALRTKAVLLLNYGKIDEACGLLTNLDLHERWCDVAVAIYAQLGHVEKAIQVAKWAAENSKPRRFWECCTNLLAGSLAYASSINEHIVSGAMGTLTDSVKQQLEASLDYISPIIDEMTRGDQLKSKYEMAILHLAWQSSIVLGRYDSAEKILHLMNTLEPLPLDVARGALNGVIAAPCDLSERLLHDYPNSFEAGQLAVLVMSICQDNHSEAFEQAKKLVQEYNAPEQTEGLVKLLLQCWVGLEGKERTDCEALIRALITREKYLRSAFEAAVLLRDGNAEKSLKKLDRNRDEHDLFALQIRAQALLALGRQQESLTVFMSLVKRMPIAVNFRKTGELAYQIGDLDTAIWCFEQLVKIAPTDVGARGALAQIYSFDRPDPDKAVALFHCLHETQPDDPLHEFNLAGSLAQAYRAVESLQIYNKLCASEPNLHAVLGRSQLLHGLGKTENALKSLEPFREHFWAEPKFVVSFLRLAYAAGDEEIASIAMLHLIEMQKRGLVPSEYLTPLPEENGIKMLLERTEQVREQTNHLQREMLQGKMPWTWAAMFSDTPFYAAWRTRTQEIEWVNENPECCSQYCIYATNGFHSDKAQSDISQLLPLECPPAGKAIVADISALITLHRLGLLNEFVAYFGEVNIPSAYLPSVIEDSRNMVIAQRSQHVATERILNAIQSGTISLFNGSDSTDLAQVDEYYEGGEHRYRLIDLIKPLHDAGTISDDQLHMIQPSCRQPSAVIDDCRTLEKFKKLIITPFTLRTLARYSLFDAAVRFFQINVLPETQRHFKIELEQIKSQEETRIWHIELWDYLRDNPQFRFLPVKVPNELRKEASDLKGYFPFLSCFLAEDSKLPLLTDDRVCQAFVLNERPDGKIQVFGSDVLAVTLQKAGAIETARAAEALFALIKWRYRFIIPPVKLLKHFADSYRSSPPGAELQEIAVYVHDCMRDPGLFFHPEKTDLGESMAMRLYISWLTIVAELIILVWADNEFSAESAERFTRWAIYELQPSLPLGMSGLLKAKAASLANRLLLSHATVATWAVPGEPRMADALKSIKEGLHLTDNEYHTLVLEILNDTARTAAKA